MLVTAYLFGALTGGIAAIVAYGIAYDRGWWNAHHPHPKGVWVAGETDADPAVLPPCGAIHQHGPWCAGDTPGYETVTVVDGAGVPVGTIPGRPIYPFGDPELVGATSHCEVCGGPGAWRFERHGDVVTTWACMHHAHDVLVNLQRDGERTRVTAWRTSWREYVKPPGS